VNIPFISSINKFKVEFGVNCNNVYGTGYANVLNIDNMYLTIYAPKIILSSQGILIYQTPSSYFKMSPTEFAFKGGALEIESLTVTGTLRVYGTTIAVQGSEVGSTTSPIYTIGSTTTAGPTTLKFGGYPTNNTLIANGTDITSSVPLNVPGLSINGFPVLTSVAVYKYLHTVGSDGISSGVHIALPLGKSYIVGNGNLLIFLDGRLQIVNEDYTEVGSGGAPSAEITFNFHLSENAKILFLIIG
jgi:hypothetical protein